MAIHLQAKLQASTPSHRRLTGIALLNQQTLRGDAVQSEVPFRFSTDLLSLSCVCAMPSKLVVRAKSQRRALACAFSSIAV